MLQNRTMPHSSEVDVDAALADAVVAVSLMHPGHRSDGPSFLDRPSMAPGTRATALVLHANGTMAAWRVHHVTGVGVGVGGARGGFDYGVLQPGASLRMSVLAVGLPYGMKNKR